MNERRKQLIKYVLPATLSSIAFFLFTIIDGIFVGHGVGTNGLGAVNLAMPFVMLVGALNQITATGGVTIVAIRLGRGDIKGANDDFMHSIIANVCFISILSFCGIFFTDKIVTLLGATGDFYQLTKDYVFWYSIFMIPSGLGMLLQMFCTNDGSPNLSMIAVISGTACNIFGDWLLIFPFGWGLKGAAIATGISQTISMLIVLTHFLHKKGKLSFFKPKLSVPLFKKIIMRGLPEGIGQISAPISILFTNIMLVKLIGDMGVNAYSLMSYVASFSIAVFMGTGQGLQPLFGRSYGAKKADDLKYFFTSGLKINVIGSLIITFALYFVGAPVCRLFGADPVTLEYTIQRMPLYAWGFVFLSGNVMISAYLYSTKRTKYSVILNLLRGLVINIAVIMVMPKIFGAESIWVTFIVYESIMVVISYIGYRMSERNGIVFR